MRFKFFSSKGSLDTSLTGNKKKKEKKKPKEETAIVCTGYRRNNEFDIPSRLRTGPQLTFDDEASSSYTPISNGNISNANNLKTNQDDTYTKVQNPPKENNSKKGILAQPKPIETSKSKIEPPKSELVPNNIYQNVTANIPRSPEVVLRRKPNFNESLNNYYDADDNQISIVQGTAGKSSPKLIHDDDKKSTLLHMTESHDDRATYDGDDEDVDYDEVGVYISDNYSNNTKSVDSAVMRNEYSSEAASIFFSSRGEEPSVQRKRNIKYKDDDEGSQTSA